VAKDVGCSQLAVSEIWSKYKQNGKIVKGKHTNQPFKEDVKASGQKTQSNKEVMPEQLERLVHVQ